MSDLSEYRHEEVVDVPISAIGFFCRDCVPEVAVSDWPADAINLPAPERGWPTEHVRVVNTAHAPTCPAFTAFVAETGAAVRFMVASDAGAENLLFRESVALTQLPRA